MPNKGNTIASRAAITQPRTVMRISVRSRDTTAPASANSTMTAINATRPGKPCLS